MKPRKLGVIGMGAIGGSVAWQAAMAGVQQVIGYSPVPKEGVAAAKVGAISDVASSSRDVVRAADFVVIATPPLVAVQLLADLAEVLKKRSVICTDVASVKTPVVTRAQDLGLSGCFAGSHPFTGTHDSGFQAARADRFVNKIVYVTPLQGGDHAAAEVSDFWQRVMQAQPVLAPAVGRVAGLSAVAAVCVRTRVVWSDVAAAFAADAAPAAGAGVAWAFCSYCRAGS